MSLGKITDGGIMDGPTGATGAGGPTGATGSTGPTGATGPGAAPIGAQASGAVSLLPIYVHNGNDAAAAAGFATDKNSIVGSYPASNAVIGLSAGNTSGSGIWWQDPNAAPTWLQVQFATKVTATTAQVLFYDATYNPGSGNWKLQGSNDGSTYTDIVTNTSAAATVTLSFSSQSWLYWRLLFAVQAGSGGIAVLSFVLDVSGDQLVALPAGTAGQSLKVNTYGKVLWG